MAEKLERRVAPMRLGGTVQVHVPDEGQEGNKDLIRRVYVPKVRTLRPGDWWLIATIGTLLILMWVMGMIYPAP